MRMITMFASPTFLRMFLQHQRQRCEWLDKWCPISDVCFLLPVRTRLFLIMSKNQSLNSTSLTGPLNHWFGRKKTIIITCLISFASCLGQAFARNWKDLFVCRLLLGLGVGPKSATIPIYAAESVTEQIRGALVMQWQLWTAFGIILGLISTYVFQSSVRITKGDTKL